MQRISVFIVGILILCVLTYGFNNAYKSNNKKIIPLAKEGALDLSQWDFDKQGTVELDGEWEYYPGELLLPHEIDKRKTDKRYYSLDMQTYSETGDMNERKIFKPESYGTYRLKVVIDRSEKLSISNFAVLRGSYKIWINDKLIDQNGEINDTSFKSNQYAQKVFRIGEIDDYFYITVQVSGYSRGILIDKESNVERLNEINSTILSMFSSCIILIGIYYFIIYWFRRENISNRYFAYFCLFISILQIAGSYDTNVYNKGINYLSFLVIDKLGYGVFLGIWNF